MTEIAWADGGSSVSCSDGTRGPRCDTDPDRWLWSLGLESVTGPTSNTKFYVQGKLVAVEDDRMAAHPDGSICTQTAVNHAPQTSLHSGKFFIGGKKALRVGSKFNRGTASDHTITSGCSDFKIGGSDG